jgi:exodeoxyribonuclease VII small subunit
MKKGEKGLDYASAYGELQDILQAMEGGEIDVDDLSAKVKRAAELIEFCQGRLKEAEVEVKRVVEKFGKDAAADDEDKS